jgi:hypothetical protein
MKDFILFMYNDATDRVAADDERRWEAYLSSLRGSGQFDGGSSIGAGIHLRRGHADRPSSTDLSGFIRIRADSLEGARGFLQGNPVYEAGGTVEIRELLLG